MKPNFFNRIVNQQDGSMMMIALMVMAILSVTGAYAINIATTDSQTTSNVEIHKMAFYNAESGVQFAIAALKNELGNNNEMLPANQNDPQPFQAHDDPDADANKPELTLIDTATLESQPFEISDIELLSDGKTYRFISTGFSYREADSSIQATFRRKEIKAFQYAAFGDKLMEVKNGGVTESYNSDSNDPTVNDPNDPNFVGTGEADVGTNESLEVKNGAQIDGDGVVGAAIDGTPGTLTDQGAAWTGTAPVSVDRIDPDPLGINSGGQYDPTTYAVNNDNGAIPTNLILGNGDTITLQGQAGGANYYFTNINLKNGSELIIDTSAGPVNIFLDGGQLSSGNTSEINMSAGTTALDLAIYANYDSDGSNNPALQFNNSSAFRGTVYAPYANVDMNNNGDVYGAIWGRTVDIRNNGVLSYDEALKNKYTIPSNDLSIASWKEE